jgi:hypothetical protein
MSNAMLEVRIEDPGDTVEVEVISPAALLAPPANDDQE